MCPTGSAPKLPLTIKPFASQQPLRGAFGDPRTLGADEPFGQTGPNDSGSDSFHNGIDIVAPDGTPVYPAVSGWVAGTLQGEVFVYTPDGRAFQYDHLVPVVHVGQFVTAEQTVLGHVLPERGHVHLTEIDRVLLGTECVSYAANPLAAGHLEPYRDRTRPTADRLYVDAGSGPRPLVGSRVGPGEHLSVRATDPPAVPLPGAYAGLPQTPALVEWRLVGGRSSSGRWHVVADFRRTEPGPLSFWRVYSPGTYQNVPVFDRRLYIGRAGRYLFRLGVQTGRLRPGSYRLEVLVADVRGNHSTRVWPIRIAR